MPEENLGNHLKDLFSDTAIPDPQPESPLEASPAADRAELPSAPRLGQVFISETAADLASQLRAWRTNVLNVLLSIMAVASMPAMAIVIIQAIHAPEQWPAVFAFAAIYLLLLGLTFARRLDPGLRAWGVLLIGYIVGVLDFTRGGLAGNGGMYFLVLSVMAVILLGARSGLIMSVLSMLAYIGLTIAAQVGLLAEWLIYIDNPLTLEAWISGGIILLMLLVLIVSMQWLFSRFLLNTLKKARQSAKELEETHRLMQQQTLELEAANLLLEKRSGALAAASEVSRAVSSMLDTETLTHQVVNLIRDHFDFYYVGVFLLDDAGRWAVLRAGTGRAGREMLAQAHRLQVGGSSMIGWCTAHGQARIALDVGQEAVRFDNPHLSETRSEMALPLISRGGVIGALTVQSVEAQAFAAEDIAVLQTMADQVANAIENARLLQETERLARRNQLVSEVSGKLRGALDLEDVLQTTVRELGQALGASEAVIRLGVAPPLVGDDENDTLILPKEVLS